MPIGTQCPQGAKTRLHRPKMLSKRKQEMNSEKQQHYNVGWSSKECVEKETRPPSVRRLREPNDAEDRQKIRDRRVRNSHAFKGKWLDDVASWQLGILGGLPSGCLFCCRAWVVSPRIRLCQSVHHCDVPSHRFATIPGYQREAIWSLAIIPQKSGCWFFGRWYASETHGTKNYFIYRMVASLTATNKMARQTMDPSTVNNGTTGTYMLNTKVHPES